MKLFPIQNWNRSATVLTVINIQLVCKISAKNIIILQLCCVKEIWIYMLHFFLFSYLYEQTFFK